MNKALAAVGLGVGLLAGGGDAQASEVDDPQGAEVVLDDAEIANILGTEEQEALDISVSDTQTAGLTSELLELTGLDEIVDAVDLNEVSKALIDTVYYAGPLAIAGAFAHSGYLYLAGGRRRTDFSIAMTGFKRPEANSVWGERLKTALVGSGQKHSE